MIAAVLKYWRVGALVALVGGGLYLGARYVNNRVTEREAAVRGEYAQAAATQAIDALHTAKKQERANEDLAAKHAARVSALHEYYRLRALRAQAGQAAGAMPAVPEGAGVPAGSAAEQGAPEYPAVCADLERRAVLDALTILGWQEWYRGHRHLFGDN